MRRLRCPSSSFPSFKTRFSFLRHHYFGIVMSIDPIISSSFPLIWTLMQGRAFRALIDHKSRNRRFVVYVAHTNENALVFGRRWEWFIHLLCRYHLRTALPLATRSMMIPEKKKKERQIRAQLYISWYGGCKVKMNNVSISDCVYFTCLTDVEVHSWNVEIRH